MRKEKVFFTPDGMEMRIRIFKISAMKWKSWLCAQLIETF